ncbi:redox-regulated ATPase YchF [archaeon]|nr:redox-regulated ATPase YchF [archaeon]
MKIGLVGKPNTGKSTFFKAATLAEVEIGDRPFVTIKPNTGTAYFKIECVDKEFNVQCQPRNGFCLNHYRFVPFDLIDVAGLIEGAHEGQGLGNKFLDDLRQADVFINVIDISGSTNEKGESVKPLSYDPIKDVKFLENEIDMWYYQILKKGWEKFVRTVKQENLDIKKALAKQLSGLKVTEDDVEDIIKELKLVHHPSEWSDDDLRELSSRLRKKTKPMIIAANKIDVEGALYNLDRLKKEFKEYMIIPCSAESELALREAAKDKLIEYVPGEDNFKILDKEKLNEKQLQALEFIKKNILEKYNTTGIQEILNYSVFDLLKYIAIFPGGVNNLYDKDGRCLPDCFLLPKNSTALDFAYNIHTDIGNKFVKAIDVKTKVVIGKEHILKHRDVIEIKTSN